MGTRPISTIYFSSLFTMVPSYSYTKKASPMMTFADPEFDLAIGEMEVDPCLAKIDLEELLLSEQPFIEATVSLEELILSEKQSIQKEKKRPEDFLGRRSKQERGHCQSKMGLDFEEDHTPVVDKMHFEQDGTHDAPIPLKKRARKDDTDTELNIPSGLMNRMRHMLQDLRQQPSRAQAEKPEGDRNWNFASV